MSKFKYILIICANFIFLSFSGIFFAYHLFQDGEVLGFSEKESIELFFSFHQGNFSYKWYLVIFPIIILLSIEYLQNKEEFIELIRYKSRFHYYVKRFKSVAVLLICFVLIYELIPLLFIVGHYNVNVFDIAFRFSIFSTILVLLYLFRVVIIYFILRDYFDRNIISLICAFCIFLIEYGVVFLMSISTPIFDLEYSCLYFSNYVDIVMLFMVILKNIAIDLLIGYIGYKVLEKKDVLTYEK